MNDNNKQFEMEITRQQWCRDDENEQTCWRRANDEAEWNGTMEAVATAAERQQDTQIIIDEETGSEMNQWSHTYVQGRGCKSNDDKQKHNRAATR